MRIDTSRPNDIDEYIAGFPADVQKILKKIRATVRKAAPRAEEKISYRMPSFVRDHSFLKMSSTNSATAALANFSASFAGRSKVKR